MKPLLSFKVLRACLAIATISLLSACATTPDPSSAGTVSFGEYPENYQDIVKNFLKAKKTRTPVDTSNIQFLNEPNKFIFEQMQFAPEKFGYRACALVSSVNPRQSREFYSLRAHFFLINNGEVIQHLHDSGLVALSDKFCNIDELSAEYRKNNPTQTVVVDPVVDEYGFKYITCQTGSDEVFFAFNPDKKQLIQQADGNNIAQFDITDLTDTFIVAEKDAHRISINRVSGTLIHRHQGNESTASCELSSQKKF